MFNNLIKEMRIKRHREHGGFLSIQQLPFTINIMLEYIVNQEKRKNLIENIQNENNFDKKEDEELMELLKNLFKSSIELH